MPTAAPARLLWTGGWDSSFRLLHLVLAQGRPVQPYYVVHRIRPSLPVELSTMDRIRAGIAATRADAADLVAPTIMLPLEERMREDGASARFARLRAGGALGLQYEWLAWCAAYQGLDGLELGIVKGGRVEVRLRGSLEPLGDSFRLADHPADPDLELFRRFRFPLVERTKLDLQGEARRLGFSELMELTWFCHAPDTRGQACGLCPPCVSAIEDGLRRRVPWRGHLRHLLLRLWRRLPSHARRTATAAATGAAARGAAIGAASPPRA